MRPDELQITLRNQREKSIDKIKAVFINPVFKSQVFCPFIRGITGKGVVNTVVFQGKTIPGR